jgi:hypothetical protein
VIYGYDDQASEDEGPKTMREVSIRAPSDVLRKFSEFLVGVADEIDQSPVSRHWHRHVPGALRKELGCDIIIFDGSFDLTD